MNTRRHYSPSHVSRFLSEMDNPILELVYRTSKTLPGRLQRAAIGSGALAEGAPENENVDGYPSSAAVGCEVRLDPFDRPTVNTNSEETNTTFRSLPASCRSISCEKRLDSALFCIEDRQRFLGLDSIPHCAGCIAGATVESCIRRGRPR